MPSPFTPPLPSPGWVTPVLDSFCLALVPDVVKGGGEGGLTLRLLVRIKKGHHGIP